MNNHAAAWQAAWRWLCQRRRHAPPNADIWHLRFHWALQGERLYQQLQDGRYRLAPMQVLRRGGRSWVQWCAQDALILKWASAAGGAAVAKTCPLHALARAWR
jgi:RNA-directed DNA polymerase